MSRRNTSFLCGGITAACLFAYGFDPEAIVGTIILSVMGFTFVSCLILKNNFIGDMILEIFSWGFVSFPGLIITLDLDGIIWFLTIKLAFLAIGLLLAVVAGLVGVTLGVLLSVVVYPFALMKNIRNGEEA